MKQIISFILVLSMLLGCASTVSAAPTQVSVQDVIEAEKEATETFDSEKALGAANELHEYGLFLGTGDDENSNPQYELDRELPRIEGVVMLIRLLGKEAEALQCTSPHPFTDVPTWAACYVNYAYKENLTKGISETEYGSNNIMRACEYVTFVLRALGYEDNIDFTWDKSCTKGKEIGLLDSNYDDEETSAQKFYRGEVALISLDSLSLKMKDGKKTLSEIATGKTISQLRTKEEKIVTEEAVKKEQTLPGGGSGSGGGSNPGFGNSGSENYEPYVPPYTPPHTHSYVLQNNHPSCTDGDSTLYSGQSFIAITNDVGTVTEHSQLVVNKAIGLFPTGTDLVYSNSGIKKNVFMYCNGESISINAPNDTVTLLGNLSSVEIYSVGAIYNHAAINSVSFDSSIQHHVYQCSGVIATYTNLATISSTSTDLGATPTDLTQQSATPTDLLAQYATNTDKRLHVMQYTSVSSFVDSQVNKITINHACCDCSDELIREYTFETVNDTEQFITKSGTYLSELSGTSGSSITLSTRIKKNAQEIIYYWYLVNTNGTKTLVESNVTGIYETGFIDARGIYKYICEAYAIIGSKCQKYTTGVFEITFTGLPTLRIETSVAQSTINRDDYVQMSSFYLNDGESTITNTSKNTVSIKGRGNASWSAPKKGYNIKFEEKTKILGMKKAKKWSLVSNYYDQTMMRNMLSSYLGKEVFTETGDQEWEPTYKYVDVYWNGQYQGVYTLVESIQLNGNRIDIEDISESFDEGNALATYSGDGSDLETLIGNGDFDVSKAGFVLEVDFRKDATYWFKSSLGIPMCLKDPDFDDYTSSQAKLAMAYIKKIINGFETILSSENFNSMSLSDLSEYIDIESFVSWYLLEEYAKNLDADFYTSVYIYYNPEDGLIYMGPDWDFDNSFGRCERVLRNKSCASIDGLWITSSQGGWASWFGYLMNNAAFKNAVITKWNSVKSDIYANMASKITEYREELSVAIILDSLKWNVLGKTEEQIMSNFENNINSLLSWSEQRVQGLSDALE